MPSQFQPYYPRSPQRIVAARQPSGQQAAGGQGAGLPIDKLIQAIQQQKAAQQLASDPDPDWLYTQPDASPAAVAQTPGSYY